MLRILTLSCCLISYAAFSQRTIIEYHFPTETYKFYKVTKKGERVETKKPYAYKGIPTQVIIKDLNTFYYDVNFKTESRVDAPIGGEQSTEELAKSFGEGYGAFNELVGEAKSSDIYQSLFVGGKFQGLEGIKSVFGMAEGAEAEKMKLIEVKGTALQATQKDIKKTSSSLKSVFDKIILSEFVNDQLQKMIANKDITPTEMKERAEVLIRKILSEPGIESVVSESESSATSLQAAYSEYREGYQKFAFQQEDLKQTVTAALSATSDPEYISSLKLLEQEIKFNAEEIANNMEALDLLVDEYSIAEIRANYLNAFESYDKIMHADFDREYSLNGDMDVTTLTMDFVRNVEGDSIESMPVIKSRKIEIPTMGGLRINSSAGITFLRFANGHYSYNNENGVVEQTSDDAFIPSLTTMFHFYRQTPRAIGFGGNFGFGVPIEGDKEFIYMLGGSAIIGKSQRVIVNFGAFGGKVERLSGVKVGDVIASGSLVPTKKIFELGGFVGLTLNINKLF